MSQKKPTIRVLYIDDEEENLESFRANFRRLYEIYTSTTASEGLKIVENVAIHVIIADQKMPNTTGVEFFKSIVKTHPDPIRILMTGFTDIEALAEAINHGDIYRYLQKPWNNMELHNTIINAFDAYNDKIALRNKIIELEKTNNELNRFIYSISHELRAPLVSTLSIINLVKMEGLYHSTNNYWQLVETCSNKLDYYIQKTLQYYKNNIGEAVKNPIDFKEMIEELIELHQFADKNTLIKLDVTQDEPFYSDKFRIEVILGNLISNAIRFQREEEKDKWVNISVEVNSQQALISINDNGMGILQEHLDKIFTQFFKGKSQFGTGLGLFIVKEALNKIEGQISVTSTPNQGTTFKISIPNGQ